MRYLSLFSGIEAATEAWRPLGWECVGVAEIEPFPCSVLAHHYPDVPNLGDITRITRDDIDALGKIDLVVGGFPCQDLSIAGKRRGLKDADGNATRSGLFFDAMRIVRWAAPRWTVIENVPGLFSSHSGRDFASVVGELAGCGFDVPPSGWRNTGVALGPDGLVEWATLDAQWFGVPQRRRRVFLVRDTGDWAGRPPILLERESLRGNPPPRREAGEGTSHDIAPSIGASGRGFNRAGDTRGHDCVIAKPLSSHPGGNRIDYETETFVTHSLRADGFDANEDGTGRGTPLVPVAIQERAICENANAGPGGAGFRTDGTAYTLEARTVPQAVAYRTNQVPTVKVGSGTGANPPAVAFNNTGQGWWDEAQNSATVRKGDDNGGGGARESTIVASPMAVRRLTPTECCRLQQFPDDYLDTHYANANEGHAAQILHELWRSAGAKGIASQETHVSEDRDSYVCEKHRIAAALLTPEILLAGVYVGWVQWPQAEQHAKHKNIEIVGESGWTDGFVRGLREAGQAGRSPYQRESFGQLARELGKPLSELPLESSQARAALQCSGLWSEAQRAWPLRYALATRSQVEKGRMNPDGPRYKALGNSMAVPVMAHIGNRINQATMNRLADYYANKKEE